MTQSRSVCNRIRNVRASLDNAERSFRSNQDVRGELDLMLAEAELENLRQKRTGWISWTRHALALCLAVLVLAAGGLGWWWASAYGGKTTNAASMQVMPESAEPKAVEIREPARAADIEPSVKKSGMAAKHEKMVQQEPVMQKAVPSSGVGYQQTGGSSVQLSSGQMRQLIRSGKQELGNIR